MKEGKYGYKKGEDLEQWWENYRKQYGHSSSSTTSGWLPDPTKSKMYVYKVKDCKWLAKNVKTGKVFVISDDPRYESSVDILNGSYKNALKGCDSSDAQTDGGQTITTPTPPPVVLPDWGKCIGDSIVGANVTKDENNVDIVFSLFGKSKGYFWNDGVFMFVYENGNKVDGK